MIVVVVVVGVVVIIIISQWNSLDVFREYYLNV